MMNIEFDATRNCFYIKDNKELAELTFTSQVLSQQELESRVRYIVQNIATHPEVLSLIKKVLNDGAVQVEFLLHENMNSTAHWRRQERSIGIATTQKDHDLIGSFVWEIVNADNVELARVAIADSKTANDYADQKERAEYLTSERTVELCALGFQNYGWGKDIGKDKASNPFRKSRTLEEYLRDVHKPSLAHHGFSHYGKYAFYYLEVQLSKLNLKRAQLNLQTFDLKNSVFKANYRLEDDEYIAKHGFRVLEGSTGSILFDRTAKTRSSQEQAADKTLIDDSLKTIVDLQQQTESVQKEMSEIEATIEKMKADAASAIPTLKQELLEEENKLKQMDEQIIAANITLSNTNVTLEILNQLVQISNLCTAAFELCNKHSTDIRWNTLSQYREQINKLYREHNPDHEPDSEIDPKKTMETIRELTARLNEQISEIEFERDSACCTQCISWLFNLKKPSTQQVPFCLQDKTLEAYFKAAS